MSEPSAPAAQAAQPGAAALGNKSAVRQYEQELEQKERAIRESIAAKISRIHEVERQLAALHNQLHVNVAPRKQALELLRHKIEEENRQIDVHRSAYSKAKAAMEAAAAALAAAEQRKAQLSEELTMLVLQSSGAQMRKLEQLSEELEHLTTGLPASAANGSSHAAASSSAATHSAAGSDAQVHVQAAAPAAGQQQKPEAGVDETGAVAAGAEGGAPAAAAVGPTAAAEQQARDEARRRQLEQQRQAVAARTRHVQLGGRRAGSSGGNGSPVPPPTRIPQPPVARTGSSGGSGRFEGFD